MGERKERKEGKEEGPAHGGDVLVLVGAHFVRNHVAVVVEALFE
jgi:hypothetical protein